MTKRARIKLALRRVNQAITDSTDPKDRYSRGMAREGYNGGYAQALIDVLLLTESDTLPRTNGWWEGIPSSLSQ